MRAKMSDRRRRYQIVEADLDFSPSDELAAYAEREARAILAETEPSDSEWLCEAVCNVRPIRIAYVPESCQITLRDMPAWSALADALRAFVEEKHNV